MITCIYFYEKIDFVKNLATVGNSVLLKELTELLTLLNSVL